MGDRFIDHTRSVVLNREVLGFCEENLRDGGKLLMKIITGPGEQKLFKDTKLLFNSLVRVKPQASRAESAEIYLLGQGFNQSREEEAVRLRKEKAKIESIAS
mmetsp:Transcript_35820/g.26610  ORF Transcript_35820/g.26610 Transcript_35820/m.26610 type:complete len:102 (+) Transcript_35820:422-727(+)